MHNTKKLAGIGLLAVGFLNLGIYTVLNIPPIFNGALVFAGTWLLAKSRH